MSDPRDQPEWSWSGVPARVAPSTAAPSGPEAAGRPWLRLWFDCSKQYARAYRLPDGSAYVGRCPSCGQSIRFGVGAGGTSERFFKVSC